MFDIGFRVDFVWPMAIVAFKFTTRRIATKTILFFSAVRAI
jgi:hypothetical protein